MSAVMTREKSEKIAPPPIRDRAWHVEWQLENWARWMGSGRSVNRLPTKASGGAENASSLDWDNCVAAYDAMDIRLASICNAVIHDLKPTERSAILYERGIALAVGLYDLETTLASAKRNVARGLISKGVWLG